MMRRRPPRVLAACAAAAIALIALDQGSKAWAIASLEDEPLVLVPGALELEHHENPGIAWSGFRDAPQSLRVIVLGSIAVAISIALAIALARGAGGPLFAIGAPPVIAGALGNAIDRVGHGTVTDFVHTWWEGVFDYPVWNLADAWILIGVVLLSIDAIRAPRSAPAAAPGAARSRA